METETPKWSDSQRSGTDTSGQRTADSARAMTSLGAQM